MSSFPERLRRLLTTHEMKQVDLAKLIGVAESTMSLYLKGDRRPDWDILNNISRYFGVTIDYLLGYTDDPSASIAEDKEYKLDYILERAGIVTVDGNKLNERQRQVIKDLLHNVVNFEKMRKENG